MLARRLHGSPLVPERARDWVLERRARRKLLASIDGAPTTFNEKVRYRMATDRRPILQTFADKLAVREYVADKVGDHLLTTLHLATDDPAALLPSALPRQFALKASHASGGVILVGDHVAPTRRLPEPRDDWDRWMVHPDSLDWDLMRAHCRCWLARRYKPYKQWASRSIPARILVEELLLVDGSVPADVKFFVFGGRAGLILVDQDGFGDHKRNLYTPSWEPFNDVRYGYPLGPAVPRPGKLEEMVAVAERLAQEVDFVRVDLYELGDRVVFGELTIYPMDGVGPFEPAEFDAKLGALWPERSQSGA